MAINPHNLVQNDVLLDPAIDEHGHDGHVHAGLQRIRIDDGIGVVIIDIMIMGLVSRIAAAAGTVLCRRYQVAFSCAAVACQEIMGNPQLLFRQDDAIVADLDIWRRGQDLPDLNVRAVAAAADLLHQIQQADIRIFLHTLTPSMS